MAKKDFRDPDIAGFQLGVCDRVEPWNRDEYGAGSATLWLPSYWLIQVLLVVPTLNAGLGLFGL
jgi:hypothetical protein